MSNRQKIDEPDVLLRDSEHCFRILVESLTDCAIYMLDPHGCVATWNSGAERIKGYAAGEIVGQHFSRFYTSEDNKAGEPAQALLTARLGGKYEQDGCWRIRKDGTAFWASVIIESVRGHDGTLLGFAKITRDISEKRLAEAQAHIAHEQLASAFRHASVGLVQVDANLLFTLVNDAFCRIVGRSRAELQQLSALDILQAGDQDSSRDLMNRVQRGEEGIVSERRYVRPDGSIVECRASISLARDETGQPASPLVVIGVIEDITERKRAEARISYLSFHDALTGLANRALLNDRLSQELRHTKRRDSQCAILALDLDRFKAINDTFGHEAGDKLLQEVASRLRNAVRTIDTVARLGGDKFVILQVDAAQPRAATEMSRRLVKVFAQPFDIGGQMMVVHASIGIALHLKADDTRAGLLTNADTALYRAKKDGGGTFRFFEETMDKHVRERRALECDLRAAMGTEQMKLYFQPQFACISGILTGFEALLRWQHPTRGAIAPMDFIPIAEETGLIVPLGLWVIEKACIEAACWTKPLRVAVNLSPAQFRGGELSGRIASILYRTGLPAERLEVELTETLLIEDTRQAVTTLRALKDMGISIALDDFGTGYSSLGYLRQFPFDRLKIDKSFVQAIGQEASALSLVQAILAMGRSLGMEVIAEGVETEQQLQILRDLQCGEIQGFLLGRPMPAEGIERYLNDVFPL
jgi:diguanylate cyclase (GGDEF)-like protein/PAS domain S-box-containing protein